MRNGLSKLFGALCLVLTGFVWQTTQANAQGGYAIKPGDTLQIEVLEDPGLNRPTLVLPDGSISFPMAGTLRASGQTLDQLGANLSAALAPNFATAPNVYVSIARLAHTAPAVAGLPGAIPGAIDVYAVGQVQAPGRKSIRPGTTLLQFLAEAGGLTRFAADKRIELHRTDRNTGQVTTYLFNFRTPAGGEKGINGGTKLVSGDVVKVPQRRLFE